MKYNRRKIILGTIMVVILILLGVGWYYIRAWKSTIKAKLTERIVKSTDSLYTLNYDALDVNLLAGNVTLQNAELLSDSTIYHRLEAAQKAPGNRFHIKVSSLKLTNLSIWDILVVKKINISHIRIDSAAIHLIRKQHAYTDSVKNKESKSLYEHIKDDFNAVKVDQITLDNMNFKLSTVTDEDEVSTDVAIDSARIVIGDFLLDANSARDTSRLFYAKEIDLDIPRFDYEFPNSVYKIKFERLTFHSKSQQALFHKIVLAPKIRKLDYFKQDKKNKAMIVLAWDTLRLEGIDMNEMASNRLLYAKYAYIKGGSASFHKDKRFQKDSISKVGEAPHQIVMKLNRRIRCDTIFVNNVDVSYQEYSAKYNQEGVITFQQAKGNITNLTNDTSKLAKDKFMRADLQAKIMGVGVLHAQFGFDMLSKNGSHTYKGTLGRMQAPAFNRILTPLLNFEFGSGNIHGIRFDMQGSDYKNWGEFRFDYDDLKINLLYAPGDKPTRKKKGVLSFLVNQLLIDDSNPAANGEHRVGHVNYTRVPSYSFFKTLWKSLQEGIQQCVGLGGRTGRILMDRGETAEER